MPPINPVRFAKTQATQTASIGHRTKAEMIARLIRHREQAVCRGDFETASSLSRRLALRLSAPET